MSNQLQVKRSGVTTVTYGRVNAFRLRVDVTAPPGSTMDPNVFIFLQRPVNPYNDTETSDFHAIASPADIAEFPVGGPREGTEFPFFRLDYVELDFRATSLLERTWLTIVADIDNLLKVMNRLAVLTPIETVTLGESAEGSESSESA